MQSAAILTFQTEPTIQKLEATRQSFQWEYDELALELEKIGNELKAAGLNPYDYAPDPVYRKNDDE